MLLKFSASSAKTKILIAIFIAFVVLAFGYAKNINPLQMQLKNMQQEQATLKSQITISQQKSQQLPLLRRHLNNLKKTLPCSLSWLSSIMPSLPQNHIQQSASMLPQLLEIIAAASIKTDISIIAIKPLATSTMQNNQLENNQHAPSNQKKQLNLNIPFQDINFVATGTYWQITHFLNCLNQSSLLIEVPTFSIHPITFGASDEQLILAATIRTYTIANYKSFAKINSAEKTITIKQNPFNQTQNNTSSLPLTTWASNELRFLGILQQNGQIWAILIAPNGIIYYVTTGTAIGIHHSTIKQITEYTITTNNSADNIYRMLHQ